MRDLDNFPRLDLQKRFIKVLMSFVRRDKEKINKRL